MLDRMKALATQKDICVLATVSGDVPHCSLMAYATGEDCREIYLATLRKTQKFMNLSTNPSVSLLIDSRELPRNQAQALTVAGRCTVIEIEPEKSRARAKLIEAHPHLTDFLDNPETALLRVSVKSLLLLDGLTEAHHIAF